jgi:formamidopyrimidine-DNA glycosylase
MPEGDTIFRAARTLHRALAGKTVVRFQTVLTQLERVNIDLPLVGRSIERVRVARQASPRAFLRRSDLAHAYAHERQLAHLSSG